MNYESIILKCKLNKLTKEATDILIAILVKYEQYRRAKKETDTYRGLLIYIRDEGIDLDYFEGIKLGLLDFNNQLFNELNEVLK